MSVEQQLVKIINDFGNQIADAFQHRQSQRSGLRCHTQVQKRNNKPKPRLQ